MNQCHARDELPDKEQGDDKDINLEQYFIYLRRFAPAAPPPSPSVPAAPANSSASPTLAPRLPTWALANASRSLFLRNSFARLLLPTSSGLMGKTSPHLH